MDPYLIKDLEAKKARMKMLNFDMQKDLLKTYRFYSTCDTLDDFAYLLQFGAEDQLMIGTDYGHADQASEIDAHSVLRARAKAGELSPAMLQKILSDNRSVLRALREIRGARPRPRVTPHDDARSDPARSPGTAGRDLRRNGRDALAPHSAR